MHPDGSPIIISYMNVRHDRSKGENRLDSRCGGICPTAGVTSTGGNFLIGRPRNPSLGRTGDRVGFLVGPLLGGSGRPGANDPSVLAPSLIGEQEASVFAASSGARGAAAVLAVELVPGDREGTGAVVAAPFRNLAGLGHWSGR